MRLCKARCRMAASFNAPILRVVRVFRKDFDQRTSLQCLSEPPDQEPSREFAPKLSPSLRICHFELTARLGSDFPRRVLVAKLPEFAYERQKSFRGRLLDHLDQQMAG